MSAPRPVTARSTRAARAGAAVRSLAPGYFALVMASGIISIGMALERHDVVSQILLVACAVAFVVLLALTVVRLVRYRDDVVEEFTDPSRDFGFFTFVAAGNVLGVRLAMAGHIWWTTALLVAAGTGWLVLGYVVPWTATLSRSERPVIATANGTWFDWVVASQSVAIAATALEPVLGGRAELALLAIICWSVGVFLYAAAGVFVSLRLMLYRVSPQDLTASYWVSMGACAITVVAGARIVEMADAPTVDAERQLVAGLSVLFWAFASWLIPVLVAAGWWRHVVRKVPLTYDAGLWSMVFPLGMYGVASIYVGQAEHLAVIGQIGEAELWFALFMWVVVLLGMAVHFLDTVIRPARPVGTRL